MIPLQTQAWNSVDAIVMQEFLFETIKLTSKAY